MRHSGNIASIIDVTYGGEGFTAKLYVHDELGRFVTVGRLSVSLSQAESMLTGIRMRRNELDQGALFEAIE